MNIEQAKEVLEKWKDKGNDGLTDERLGYIEGWYNKKDDVAFDIAIKSLDMWDKVIEEIKSNKPSSIDVELDVELIGFAMGLSKAIDIIEKYKKEIELL